MPTYCKEILNSIQDYRQKLIFTIYLNNLHIYTYRIFNVINNNIYYDCVYKFVDFFFKPMISKQKNIYLNTN